MYSSHSILLFAASLLIPLTTSQNTFEKSSKRGLVFVPSTNYPNDNQIWDDSNSDLTWYYNYSPSPSPAYLNRTQTEFEFVPMLWGIDDTFLSTIKSLISSGTNVTHVMGFNEPDGTTSTGGSAISPSAAASAWISQVQPLKKLGVQLGAPAVTGSPSGFTWLQQFFDACASQGTNCTVDFVPVHWYGNFEGLASHVGQVSATFPNASIWITEFALPDANLTDTQSFFNSSAEFMDRTPYVDRYSYFGSFRSSASNVGPNVAMLDQKGRLTDIGSWYLGGAATNNVPSAAVKEFEAVGIMGISLVAVAVGFCLF